MASAGVSGGSLDALREGASNRDYISGLTHKFYRYPARFSPKFAEAAIECFSRPGDLILDPFMGGGTTVVEAMAAGRRVIGSDINSLSLFVCRVKTTPLRREDVDEVKRWRSRMLRDISILYPRHLIAGYVHDPRTRNLHLPANRSIKKGIAVALRASDRLQTRRSREFTRCVVLRSAQLALDSRKQKTTLAGFRDIIDAYFDEMLSDLRSFGSAIREHRLGYRRRRLITVDAGDIHNSEAWANGEKADLVLTSPPYPGVHVLYHRWQVDGRRETPAPYWIAAYPDGNGAAYYTFCDRGQADLRGYFGTLRRAFSSIRKVTRRGGLLVQMVAFGEPRRQLPRYLLALSLAGFDEVRDDSSRHRRIWRDVPNRKWHARIKGDIATSREVVLVHRAT